MERELTMGSLFDGIGGFPLAAVRCGIRPLWASEIETFPIAVTKQRFPGMEHLGDITRLDGAKLPPVDIICGGSPCQDSAWPERVPDCPGRAPACFWSKSASSRRCGRRSRSAGAQGAGFVPAFWYGRMCLMC